MRKFFKNIKNRANEAIVNVQATIESKKAEGYVDTAVKIIIAVVVGGVILAGLYTLFNGTIIPTVTTELDGMFDYSGT